MNDTKKKDDLLDDDIPALDDRRVSVPLTKENARFYRSKGNLISLDLTHENGEHEVF